MTVYELIGELMAIKGKRAQIAIFNQAQDNEMTIKGVEIDALNNKVYINGDY